MNLKTRPKEIIHKAFYCKNGNSYKLIVLAYIVRFYILYTLLQCWWINSYYLKHVYSIYRNLHYLWLVMLYFISIASMPLLTDHR